MPEKLKVKEVVNKDLGGVAARCVQSETDFGNEVFCIDPKTETLLIHESRSRRWPRWFAESDSDRSTPAPARSNQQALVNFAICPRKSIEA